MWASLTGNENVLTGPEIGSDAGNPRSSTYQDLWRRVSNGILFNVYTSMPLEKGQISRYYTIKENSPEYAGILREKKKHAIKTVMYGIKMDRYWI